MNEVGTLNLMESDLTNKDIVVTYVPNTFVTSYEYTIYKDGVIYKNVSVDNSDKADIKLDKTGNYKISIKASTLKFSLAESTKTSSNAQYCIIRSICS